MRTSTRVYPLEEGDVSMIARAWLTEAAERSIDVQYFIFSADNVGLNAVDYMLRAADREAGGAESGVVESVQRGFAAADRSALRAIELVDSTTRFGDTRL